MNIRVLKSKEILYPQNLFMDISDAEPTKKDLEGLLYAVEKLSAEERELISLRYGEKLSVTRVAECLGRERAVVLNEISAVLSRLSSPMLFNYITYGRKKWEKIASLDPAERMKRISEIEGKPIDELDASYLDLPCSVNAALNRSHTLCAPYTAADAAKCVFGKPHSRLIPESDRQTAAAILQSCGFTAPKESRRGARHGSRKNNSGYPLNLYRCIFGETCPAPDSDMLKGLAQAVSEIPEPGRQVIILLFEKGISYKNIAEQLSLPLETVRQHESRALRYLRRGGVRRMLRYGASRSKLLNTLKGNRGKALSTPLNKLMTESTSAELAEMGVHTVAEATSIDAAGCSLSAAYELNDILSFLEI